MTSQMHITGKKSSLQEYQGLDWLQKLSSQRGCLVVVNGLQVQSPLAAKKNCNCLFILQVQSPLPIHFAILASELYYTAYSFCSWASFPYLAFSSIIISLSLPSSFSTRHYTASSSSAPSPTLSASYSSSSISSSPPPSSSSAPLTP